jgi:hypothetical protein
VRVRVRVRVRGGEEGRGEKEGTEGEINDYTGFAKILAICEIFKCDYLFIS